jgi:hypothetical protein
MPRKLFIFILIIAALVTVLMSPLFQCSSTPAPKIKQVAQLNGLGSLLRDYARDHDGVLPARLEEVAKPPSGSDVLLLFVNPTTGEKSPWNYNASGKNLKELNLEDVIVSSSLFHDRGREVRLQLMGDWSPKIVNANSSPP